MFNSGDFLLAKCYDCRRAVCVWVAFNSTGRQFPETQSSSQAHPRPHTHFRCLIRARHKTFTDTFVLFLNTIVHPAINLAACVQPELSLCFSLSYTHTACVHHFKVSKKERKKFIELIIWSNLHKTAFYWKNAPYYNLDGAYSQSVRLLRRRALHEYPPTNVVLHPQQQANQNFESRQLLGQDSLYGQLYSSTNGWPIIRTLWSWIFECSIKFRNITLVLLALHIVICCSS